MTNKQSWGDFMGMIRFQCDMIFSDGCKGKQDHWKRKNKIEEEIKDFITSKSEQIEEEKMGEWGTIEADEDESQEDYEMQMEAFNAGISKAIEILKK